MKTASTDRIHKVLANVGVGSRREIETWIRQGRIQVNGRVAAIGDRITLKDRIRIDGKPVRLKTIVPTQMRILAYYKPAGELCTRKDPEGRKTVFSSLPKLDRGRWVTIGRLDMNTTGLLLLTNDGDLANRFMHPSSAIEREYAVRVLGKAGKRQLENLQRGVMLEDGPGAFTRINDAGGEGANHWYHVVILEGRNREVRRLWESQGMQVSRLIRIRYASYSLPRKKRPGQYWELAEEEVRILLRDLEAESEKVKGKS